MPLLDRLADRVFRLPPRTGGYRVDRGLRIPVRDGVGLAADHYTPAGTAVGTILVRGPYGRHFPYDLLYARPYAARGYHVLFVSSRGTAASGGDFDPMRTEHDDGQDVVAWLVAQPWFTGTFATIGPSYLGFTQWAVLADPPPELTRAVISVGPHDFSRHSWGRSRNVTEGYVRLDPARDDSAIRLPLLPTAHRFRAGCRIRVLVAGGSHPQYARNLGTAENPGTGTKLVPARHTVAAGSRLLLPVTDPR